MRGRPIGRPRFILYGTTIPVYNTRMTRQKTAEEVVQMEEVQRAAEAAMSAVIQYLSTDRAPTSETAHDIIDRVLEVYDCESPEGHIVAGGAQAIEPHERGHGPINTGEAIVIDIFPRSKSTGYFADMTRTVCIGEPPPDLQNMYYAVSAAHDLAILMIRPGISGKDLHEVASRYFIDAGYLTSGKGNEFSYAEGFVHSLGHGVGRAVHEAPRVSPKSEDVLVAGDVITIEPGLYYPGMGGIRIEDMVQVTEDGYRNLTQFEKRFVIGM